MLRSKLCRLAQDGGWWFAQDGLGTAASLACLGGPSGSGRWGGLVDAVMVRGVGGCCTRGRKGVWACTRPRELRWALSHVGRGVNVHGYSGGVRGQSMLCRV